MPLQPTDSRLEAYLQEALRTHDSDVDDRTVVTFRARSGQSLASNRKYLPAAAAGIVAVVTAVAVTVGTSHHTPTTPMTSGQTLGEGAPTGTALSQMSGIYPDGTLVLNNLIWTVPIEWTKHPYTTRCSSPIDDYAFIPSHSRDSSGPQLMCSFEGIPPVEGIILADASVAASWMDTKAAGTQLAINGISALMGTSTDGSIVISIPSYHTFAQIQASGETVQKILDSVRLGY